MPPPFQRLTVPQFAHVLDAFRFERKVTAVHMHHTWRPDHSTWRGERSMEGMWHSHTQERGFSDIAQHLTIDPEGQLWTGRDWNAAPASAIGHNGNRIAGPFMIEVVGNFDKGNDPFDGAQRAATFDVISLVQRRFGLDAEALLFHNQVAPKTCPGTLIDRTAFVAALRAHVPSLDAAAVPAARGRKPMPLPASAFADTEATQRLVRWLEAQGAGARGTDPLSTPIEELEYSHGPARDGARGLIGGDDLSAADLDALRPHVLNLRQGRFSSDGRMTSSEADVDAILFEHAAAAGREALANGRPLRLLLYAHGGLVKESTGLRIARSHVGWWRDNGVYPIHFVWETGLFETLRDLLSRARDGAAGARGVISDFITDPLIEAGARALQAPRIWGSMKSSALLASAPGGAALFFVQRLAQFCKQFVTQQGAKALELHAVGHSAGSIFMAHLLQAAAKDVPAFSSLHLMAPAIRADLFQQLVTPLAGTALGPVSVYTMRRDFERDDHCALIYRKSLLYLVRAACEPEQGTPILGLEESLRDDAALRAFFGLGASAGAGGEVVWSQSAATEGRSASRAVRHGDFDNDAPTMESIARRVLDLPDTAPLARRFPGDGSRGQGDPWQDGVDWPPGFPVGGGGGAAPATAFSPVAPAAPPRIPGSLPTGRRLALCVGIDTYPSAPLSGCVNDARLWQQTLQALGFEVRTLFNEEARLEGLVGQVRRLLAEASAGDEIVFQFAGHGTQAPDLDGDEAQGDTPGLDEALCPHDFDAGPLLIDDEIGALINAAAPGVRLTFFMDCCHSGSNTRAAPAPGAKPRGLRLSPAQQRVYTEWHHGRPAGRFRAAKRADSDPIEVSFSACQSKELAWESEGHGEFTLRATRVLREGGDALGPDAFYERVLRAFGAARRQTPQLTSPPDRLGQPLFRRR